MTRPVVCVLGLGLIGGSIAAALMQSEDYDTIIGWDIDNAQTKQALEKAYITMMGGSLRESVRTADVIILAMPVKAIIDALDTIAEVAKPNTLIIDVGSTKATIVDAMASLPEHLRAVGGHPMAGKQTSGVTEADANLFQGRVFILTPTKRSDDAAMQRASEIVKVLGSRLLIMDAAYHDQLVAIISHMVRLIPIAMVSTANQVADDIIWELAAGGFRESTRLVTHDLGFWRDVLATNQAGISQALRAFADNITQLADLIEQGDVNAIEGLDQQARRSWRKRYQHDDLSGERGYRMTTRVAYLGIRGAFSERAARQHFGDDIVDIAAKSFDHIFEAVHSDEADFGVLPIENSLAGTVANSYELLTKYDDIYVVGEIILQVRHALMTLPNTTLDEIEFVRSHPQALAQCSQYLDAHNMEPINWYNTAGSAKDLANDKTPKTAAIASADVAEMYGLELLATDIQDVDNNFTRFLVLSKQVNQMSADAKASVIFITKHEPGALVSCLQVISDAGYNLTKIESRPIRDTPWEYIFYIDFTQNDTSTAIDDVLQQLREHASMVRLLGTYPVDA